MPKLKTITKINNQSIKEEVNQEGAFYSLYNYFDVWGNKKEGYEINNQCIEFDDLWLSHNLTNKEILSYLKQTGFFTNKADLRTIEIIDQGDLIEFYHKKSGSPICALMQNYRNNKK